MLKPVKAPLSCFGLDYKATDPICQACPHAPSCTEYMGDRLQRIAIGEAKFCLVPDSILRRTEEPNEANRDIEAIYIECWRQVFGGEQSGSVGQFRTQLMRLAKKAEISVPLFILINMYGFSQTAPAETFKPGMLIDGRALSRVKLYADACKERFGALNTRLFDAMTGSDLAVYSLEKRMLEAEIKAATWIIDFKLWHSGLPYTALFDDLECELEPYWLATEQHYEPILRAYSQRIGQPKNDTERIAQRHEVLEVYARMKKHKHDAISNFRTREKVMPEAVVKVLSTYGYKPDDFEIPNKPVLDPLLLWNRLGVAIQHLECLLFVNYQEGIYAKGLAVL